MSQQRITHHYVRTYKLLLLSFSFFVFLWRAPQQAWVSECQQISSFGGAASLRLWQRKMMRVKRGCVGGVVSERTEDFPRTGFVRHSVPTRATADSLLQAWLKRACDCGYLWMARCGESPPPSVCGAEEPNRDDASSTGMNQSSRATTDTSHRT